MLPLVQYRHDNVQYKRKRSETHRAEKACNEGEADEIMKVQTVVYRNKPGESNYDGLEETQQCHFNYISVRTPVTR